eukprot:scaffold2963_cov250-Pinguiococcus_pyrenoidosus.AAC.15
MYRTWLASGRGPFCSRSRKSCSAVRKSLAAAQLRTRLQCVSKSSSTPSDRICASSCFAHAMPGPLHLAIPCNARRHAPGPSRGYRARISRSNSTARAKAERSSCPSSALSIVSYGTSTSARRISPRNSAKSPVQRVGAAENAPSASSQSFASEVRSRRSEASAERPSPFRRWASTSAKRCSRGKSWTTFCTALRQDWYSSLDCSGASRGRFVAFDGTAKAFCMRLIRSARIHRELLRRISADHDRHLNAMGAGRTAKRHAMLMTPVRQCCGAVNPRMTDGSCGHCGSDRQIHDFREDGAAESCKGLISEWMMERTPFLIAPRRCWRRSPADLLHVRAAVALVRDKTNRSGGIPRGCLERLLRRIEAEDFLFSGIQDGIIVY